MLTYLFIINVKCLFLCYSGICSWVSRLSPTPGATPLMPAATGSAGIDQGIAADHAAVAFTTIGNQDLKVMGALQMVGFFSHDHQPVPSQTYVLF